MDNLPNLHPLLVHFPIALFSVVILLEAMRIVFNKSWINISALFLSGLSMAGAIAAYLTGRIAVDGFELKGEQISAVAEHSDLALESLLLISVYFIARLSLYYLKRGNRIILKSFIFILSLVPMLWIARTADAGGALVYRYNMGRVLTNVLEKPDRKKEIKSSKNEKLKIITKFNKKGIWKWENAKNDKIMFTNTFRLLNNKNISVIRAKDSIQVGLPITLKIKSEKEFRFIFPEPSQNVDIEILLDLGDFIGAFSLFHNYSLENNSLDVLRLDGKNISFARLERKKEKLYGNKLFNTKKKLRLKLVAYQKHFQAYVDGKLILHGHAPPLEGKKVGFLLNGLGDINIFSLQIQNIKKK